MQRCVKACSFIIGWDHNAVSEIWRCSLRVATQESSMFSAHRRPFLPTGCDHETVKTSVARVMNISEVLGRILLANQVRL